MRRIRSDSALDALPAEQKELLEGWLVDERLSLAQTRERLQKEFGVTVSRDSISRYLQRLKRLEQVEHARNTRLSSLPLPADWEDKANKAHETANFLLVMQVNEALTHGGHTVQELVQMGQMLLKIKAQELRERRIALQEQSAQAYQRELPGYARSTGSHSKPPSMDPAPARAAERPASTPASKANGTGNALAGWKLLEGTTPAKTGSLVSGLWANGGTKPAIKGKETDLVNLIMAGGK